MKLKSLIDLLFPRYCLVCEKAIFESYEDYMCLVCFGNLPIYLFGLGRESPVNKAFWGRCEIDFGGAYLVYDSGSRYSEILKEIKYRDRPDLAVFMGKNYGYWLLKYHTSELKGIDAWFPVPMAKKKQRSRGYNQAALIARGLSLATGIPTKENYLVRRKTRESQTKMSRFERWLNAKSVYDCEEIPNDLKHIGIIDDVLTTGATIEACIDAVRKHGPIKISVFTLAYTQ